MLQVHDAIEDVKRDISNISKYRENETVMQAFQKLLEVGQGGNDGA